MQQAWTLKDEVEWEKFRLISFYAANTMFFKKPIKEPKEIIELPSIDGSVKSGYDKIIEKAMANREKLKADRMKREQNSSPAE